MRSLFRYHPEAFTPASDLPLFDLKVVHEQKRVAETSAIAYRELKPSLSQREEQVLNALRTFTEPATAYEVAGLLMRRELIRDVNYCRPRITALYARGIVVRCDKRPCEVTGKTAFTWRVKA